MKVQTAAVRMTNLLDEKGAPHPRRELEAPPQKVVALLALFPMLEGTSKMRAFLLQQALSTEQILESQRLRRSYHHAMRGLGLMQAADGFIDRIICAMPHHHLGRAAKAELERREALSE